MTVIEARSLAAAGRAQKATDRPIALHLDIGSPADDYDRALDALEAGGADLGRLAIAHLVPRPDGLPLFRRLVARGAFLSFDLFGQHRRQFMDDLIMTDPEVQASSIKGLIDSGLGSNMLLSQNVNHVELMTVNGGDGYAHLSRNVLPLMTKYGVTSDEIELLMLGNPARWLAGEDATGA